MAAKLRVNYEQNLLDELRDLPESELPKLLKLIHFLKEEILAIEKGGEADLLIFWESFGSWKDERSSDEIIKEIYESRKSTTRDIQL
jgi:hypothetical protein